LDRNCVLSDGRLFTLSDDWNSGDRTNSRRGKMEGKLPKSETTPESMARRQKQVVRELFAQVCLEDAWSYRYVDRHSREQVTVIR